MVLIRAVERFTDPLVQNQCNLMCTVQLQLDIQTVFRLSEKSFVLI